MQVDRVLEAKAVAGHRETSVEIDDAVAWRAERAAFEVRGRWWVADVVGEARAWRSNSLSPERAS